MPRTEPTWSDTWPRRTVASFEVDTVRAAGIFAAMNGERADAEIATGAVLAGKYRVEGTVGIGGMGIVLAAKHLDLDRLVAIKVMRAEIC